MNARQKAKKLKKEINILESDNNLMRRIIADSTTMKELYDAYNKPVFVTQTTMKFQELRTRRIIPAYMADVEEVIERSKQAAAEDLFECVKDNITYVVDDKDRTPIITASIFIGRR